MIQEERITIDISVEQELRQRILRLSRTAGCSEEELIADALQSALSHLEQQKDSLRSET